MLRDIARGSGHSPTGSSIGTVPKKWGPMVHPSSGVEQPADGGDRGARGVEVAGAS